MANMRGHGLRRRLTSTAAIVVVLLPMVVSVMAPVGVAAADTGDESYYISELRTRFGPVDATDDELRILLAGPVGGVWRSFVDGARTGAAAYSSDDEAEIAQAQLLAGLLEWAGSAAVSKG